MIDGGRLERSVGLAIGLNRFEGKSAVALDQFERDARHGGSGTMARRSTDRDTIVTLFRHRGWNSPQAWKISDDPRRA